MQNLRAWIFRVGLNAAKDMQRSAWHRRSRPLLGEDTMLADRAAAPGQGLEEQEDLVVRIGLDPVDADRRLEPLGPGRVVVLDTGVELDLVPRFQSVGGQRQHLQGPFGPITQAQAPGQNN